MGRWQLAVGSWQKETLAEEVLAESPLSLKGGQGG